MDDEARQAVIRQFVEAINTGEMEPLDALYHDDVVIEWPQSGELIRGRRTILVPGRWATRLRRWGYWKCGGRDEHGHYPSVRNRQALRR